MVFSSTEQHCSLSRPTFTNRCRLNIQAQLTYKVFDLSKLMHICFFSLRYFDRIFCETFWSLKQFSHLSHSCIKTHHKCVH